MKRLLKWALLVLVIANIGLVVSGLLDAQTVLVVGLVIEALIVVVGVYNVGRAVRAYRRDRATGLDMEQALESGLEVFFPGRMARLIALEPRIWYLVGRWLFRRREMQPGEFGYNKRSMMGSLVAIVIVSTPVEVLLVELLVPWEWLRWVLGIGAVYGVVWLIGVVVSLRVLPHRLERDGLRINYGVLASGFVRYGNVELVEAGRVKMPKEAGEGLVVPKGSDEAYVAAGGRADVTIRLREPVRLRRLVSETPFVRTIYLAADDGARLVGALRERLEVGVDVEGGAIGSELLVG